MRLLGARVGEKAYVHDVLFQNIYVNGLRNFISEDKATIQPGCILDLADTIILREMATLSVGVIVCTHSDPGKKMGKPLAEFYPPYHAPVEFGRGCWVGAGAVIMPGVRIGEMAVVAAGAVVTKDVPDRTVVAGIPAKAIQRVGEDR